MREVVIVDSVRTGLAKSFRGKFNQTRPDDMAAHRVNALLTRNGIDPATVEDCIVGAGSNEGAQGYNIGRNVAVLSRLGTGTAGMTLNRFCSSGLQAIAIAANQIASGCSDIIVAGGVESISLTMKSVNTDNLINPLLKAQVPGLYFPWARPPKSLRAAITSAARTRTGMPCKASSAPPRPRPMACSTMKSCRWRSSTPSRTRTAAPCRCSTVWSSATTATAPTPPWPVSRA